MVDKEVFVNCYNFNPIDLGTKVRVLHSEKVIFTVSYKIYSERGP
jgi:hypothetical protein